MHELNTEMVGNQIFQCWQVFPEVYLITYHFNLPHAPQLFFSCISEQFIQAEKVMAVNTSYASSHGFDFLLFIQPRTLRDRSQLSRAVVSSLLCNGSFQGAPELLLPPFSYSLFSSIPSLFVASA